MVTRTNPGVMNLPFLMPEQYGAAGDGVTDDSVAVRDCIQASIDTGMTAACYGTYKCTTANHLAFSMEGTSQGEDILTLVGGGMAKPTFLFGDGGGFVFTGTGASRQHTVHMSSLRLEPISANSGVPLSITGTEGGLRKSTAIKIRDLEFGPTDIVGSNDFSDGVRFTGLYRPHVSCIRGYQGNNCTHTWNSMVDFFGSYDPWLGDKSWLNCRTDNGGATVGVKWGGKEVQGPEGYMQSQTIINGALRGIEMQFISREALANVIGGHINADDACIYVDGVKYLWVSAVGMYLSADTTQNDKFLHIVNCDGAYFSNMARTNEGQGTYYLYASPRPADTFQGVARDAGVVRNIKVDDFVLAGTMKTSVEPYFIDSGCDGIEINMPNVLSDDDFAQHPADMVHVSAGATNVSINTANSSISYDDGALSGPTYKLARLSESPANSDRIGALEYEARNAAGTPTTMTTLLGSVSSMIAGQENGQWDAFLKLAGTDTSFLRLLRPSTSGETGMFLIVREPGNEHTLHRVTVGAADSGGTGFRTLQVPNT